MWPWRLLQAGPKHCAASVRGRARLLLVLVQDRGVVSHQHVLFTGTRRPGQTGISQHPGTGAQPAPVGVSEAGQAGLEQVERPGRGQDEGTLGCPTGKGP